MRNQAARNINVGDITTEARAEAYRRREVYPGQLRAARADLERIQSEASENDRLISTVAPEPLGSLDTRIRLKARERVALAKIATLEAKIKQ